MELLKILKKYSKDTKRSGYIIFEDTDKKVYVWSCDSPVGKITGVADDDFVYMVSFEDRSKNVEKKIQAISDELPCQFVEEKNKILQKFEDELSSYFEGKCKKFTVPLKMIGSQFQKDVWNKLLELPYGSTQTYGDLAKALGRPASHARAIGAACGANSHLLVVPCHRLVACGSKGGFSSGIDRKEWLLDHEKKNS